MKTNSNKDEDNKFTQCKFDENGMIKMQLLKLMNVFGESCINGNEAVFENMEILLPTDKLTE